MTSTLDVGKKLVELCRQGKALEAMNTLYSDDVVSIEAQGNEAMPARMQGLVAIKGKGEWWEKNHEVHRAEAQGPWPHNDRFIVHFSYDATPKIGLMAGKMMSIEEAALYTVKDSKIAQEEFFYNMGG